MIKDLPTAGCVLRVSPDLKHKVNRWILIRPTFDQLVHPYWLQSKYNRNLYNQTSFGLLAPK